MRLAWRTIAALAVAGLLATAASAAPPRATLDSGLVQGVAARDGKVAAFKGLPYAAPPLGALRWAPPTPVAPWTGVRKADAFAPECAQPPPPPGQPNAYPKSGEDCLYLNVWTPASTARARLPVMLWFYGGGFVGGGTSNPEQDGEPLARRDVVVVSVNYRTGVFGYLAHPLLTQANGFAGNIGLMDEIAALKWVQANIAAFGGDPARVTIAGQSSGGVIVNNLMTTAAARGLFAQAIVMSAPPWGLTPPMRSKELAEVFGSWFMDTRGARTLEEMRALPADVLLKMTPQEAALSNPPFQPIADGVHQQRIIGDMIRAGRQAPVPLLIGVTRDELSRTVPAMTAAQYEVWARRLYGDAAPAVMQAFPPLSATDAQWAAGTARSASMVEATVVEAQLHSRIQPATWLYRFDRTRPGPDAARTGAAHGADVAYVFDRLEVAQRPWTARDRELADQMADFWANFVKTGDPNGEGLPAWPAMKADAPVAMAFGDDASVGGPVDNLPALKTTRRLIDPDIQP